MRRSLLTAFFIDTVKSVAPHLRRSAKYLTCFALFGSALLLFSFANDPDVIQRILARMKSFYEERPQEKLYLHFDKPFYAAGDNIWFKAYLVEASLHQLDSQSRVVYVDLSNNSKTILQRKVLVVTDGVSVGDFELPDTLQQGKYLIRAYTNYMRNVGEDFFFKKEFSILNPSSLTNRQDKVLDRDSIDLQFLPESGNLVAVGTEVRIAFKAISPDGKGIDVQGDLLDESNTVITSFQTAHDGMGILRLNPSANKKYFARITKPYKVNRSYPLPPVIAKGYAMQVTEIAKHIKVVIYGNVDKPASGKLVLNLVIQSRGKVYHAQQTVISTNATFALIPRSKFPEGITQIVLFDDKGNPVAERLVYQDQGESLNVEVKTDNSSYRKRELVTVDATALYRNGTAAMGNFSIAVYDDILLNSAEKHPLTITNYLYLTSDLKGHVDNPGYYFKDSLPETKKHRDLLMMVHGWRRFLWTDVLNENLPTQKYVRELGIPIRGKVQKAWSKNAPEDSNLKIMTMKGDVVVLKPDSLGKFYTDAFLFYDTVGLVIQTENKKGKKQPYKFFLEPLNPSPLPVHSMSPFVPFDASKYLDQQYEQKEIDNAKENAIQLKEVQVTAKKINPYENDSRSIGSSSGDRIDPKRLPGGFTNIFQMLQARVAGMIVSGTPPNMRVTIRGQTPQFLMNGMVSSAEMIGMTQPGSVEMIEVIKGPGASVYGGVGVINVILKKGEWIDSTIGMNSARYPGFYQAREFYAPRYDVPVDSHNLADKRTTLYWNPVLKTDGNGKASLFFYAADANSRYRVVIEGITPDGYPGTSSTTFEVK